jgi:hypothetical protein
LYFPVFNVTEVPLEDPGNDFGERLLPDTVMVKSEGFFVPPLVLSTLVVTFRNVDDPIGELNCLWNHLLHLSMRRMYSLLHFLQLQRQHDNSGYLKQNLLEQQISLLMTLEKLYSVWLLICDLDPFLANPSSL